jgi:hypothetical protein
MRSKKSRCRSRVKSIHINAVTLRATFTLFDRNRKLPYQYQTSYSMASTTQPHPSFPSRPYSNTLHGKLPERNLNAPFGSSVHTANRENARIERERQERERGAGPSNPLPTITDEQKEEINEAVCSCATALLYPDKC